MTRPISAFALLCAAALAACGAPESRVAIPKLQADERQSIAYRSVSLREVSLPSYAASEEIFVAGEDGLLSPNEGLLWADDPSRAITLELSRHLSQITGAQVASEPWPFDDYPQVEVELRIETMLPGADNVFRLSGQYFVAPENGRDRSRLFDLAVPIVAEGAGGIAAARGRAVQDLALDIARNGLR
ncbi:PqiC family protein [Roseovarius aestuariivivens]|uniref:PqiC family protein n=1 Tax=Roseovarius aestuariivivens TaxID=1888910 RepID=UPI001080174A|nr:ABC-type transport auxiliary lipoprotein family protein [Roseovarius aestuariivivens]